MEDNFSLVAEVEQGIFADSSKQFPAVVGDYQHSKISIPNDKSQDGELSILPAHYQNAETTNQGAMGAYEAPDNANDNTSSLPFGKKEELGDTGTRVISSLENIIESLRAVALTREEAQKAENLLWDMKGELYAAEKRGRVKG